MEEATITGNGAPAGQPQPQLPPECEMTTDDLVLMIGEGAVRERQSEKIKRYQGNVIQHMQAQAGKAASLAQSIEDGKKSTESLRARIDQLERQVHDTALERDEAQKKVKELEQEIDLLRAGAKPKRSVKK